MDDKAFTQPNLLSHQILTIGEMTLAFLIVPKYMMHAPGYLLFRLNKGVPHTLQKCFFPSPAWKLPNFS